MSVHNVRSLLNKLKEAVNADPNVTRSGYHQHMKKTCAVLEALVGEIAELERRVDDAESAVNEA